MMTIYCCHNDKRIERAVIIIVGIGVMMIIEIRRMVITLITIDC